MTPITLNKLLKLLLVVLCLMAASFAPFIFCNSPVDKEESPFMEEQQKEHAMSKTIYLEEMERLARTNDSLSIAYSSTKAELDAQRKKTKSLERALKRRLTEPVDSHAFKEAAIAFIDASNTGDSLCDQALSACDSLLQVKDSTILLCQIHLQTTDSLLFMSILQGQELQTALHEQTRKANSRKRAIGLLGALAAGLALGLLNR